MSKKLAYKENFRVVIDPRGLGDFGSVSCSPSLIYGQGKVAEKLMQRDMEIRCEEIEAEVKRHVDNVSSVWTEWDEVNVCSHCGSIWTEKNNVYNGGCCDEDEKANLNNS